MTAPLSLGPSAAEVDRLTRGNPNTLVVDTESLPVITIDYGDTSDYYWEPSNANLGDLNACMDTLLSTGSTTGETCITHAHVRILPRVHTTRRFRQ